MVCCWGIFVKLQLKAIKNNRKNTTSVKKSFPTRNETVSRISEDFHILDHRDHFVHIEIDMLMKYELSVKYEVQILPSISRV